MGGVYRNPLKKYDSDHSTYVCGLVNQRLLWLADTGSLTETEPEK